MTEGTTTKHIEAIHAAAVSAPVARDGRHHIELKVRNINALFNSLDPAPFREKDLDAAAEAFIVGWARVPLRHTAQLARPCPRSTHRRSHAHGA